MFNHEADDLKLAAAVMMTQDLEVPVDLLAVLTDRGVTMSEVCDCAADLIDDYAQDAFEEAGDAAAQAQGLVDKADELRDTGEAVRSFEREFL